MKCQACDCILTDQEATRRNNRTGEFLDMCNTCLGLILDDLEDAISPEDELWDDYSGAEEEEENEEEE